MIIDAKDTVLGRIGSYAAKKALLGEKIDVINCEYAIITGSKKFILHNYRKMEERGTPFSGPFIQKVPDKLVRRTIRGMIPYKKPRGRAAFKNIKCYKGIPEQFKDKETIKLPWNLSKLKILKYLTIKDLCKQLKG